MRQKDLQELKRKRRLGKKLARVQQRRNRRDLRSMGAYDHDSRREEHLKRLVALQSSQAILSSLDERFERALFVSALHNLTDTKSPIRFNNFAYAMREVILTILRKAAPASKVERCSWYTNESGRPEQVTRGERVRYAIQGGLSKEKVSELLLLDDDENQVEELVSNFPKLFQESLNEHTHIKQETFNIGDERTEDLAHEVLDSVHEILDLIDGCKHEINHQVTGQVDNAILGEFLGTVFPDLDLLSTHTTVDQVDVEEHSIQKIDNNQVHIRGSGTVYVDLQYGSGSDMRRGMGAESQGSFPFEFSCTAKISDLDQILVAEEDIEVDTSSFYE